MEQRLARKQCQQASERIGLCVQGSEPDFRVMERSSCIGRRHSTEIHGSVHTSMGKSGKWLTLLNVLVNIQQREPFP